MAPMNLFSMPTATPRTNNIVPNTPPVWLRFQSAGDPGPNSELFSRVPPIPIQPPQSLTFGLGAGQPAGATINGFSGQFTWTPPSAPLTNLVSIIVSDSGSPSMSATQTFMVTVFPPPQLGSINRVGNQFVFTLPTLSGQGYQIEFKNDLSLLNWTPLGPAFIGSGSPVSITNSINSPSQRFFRARLLP